MGNYITKAKADMASTIEQKTTQMTQTQLTSQIAMQNEMRQRQLAMQIGINRERFQYYNIFYLGLVPLLLIGGIKSKKPQLVVPVLPLSCAYAFQYDMAYGVPWRSKPLMVRAKEQGEGILTGNDPYFKIDVLDVPTGMPKFAEIQKKAKDF